MTASSELPQAGWYANPNNSEELRFWDGTAWTSQVRPVVCVTSRDDVPGHRVSQILGLCAGFADTVLKLSYSAQPRTILERAESQLKSEAAALGADAVVAVQVTATPNMMLLVGTAVRLERI